MQVQDIQVGWRWLEGVLNRMIGAINGNEPLEGSGIRIVDTHNGKLISVASETTGGGGGGSAGGGGGGAQEPHLLATGIIWYGVKWQDVTVVDPSSCAQATLSVLVHTGDDNDSITIEPVKYPFWVQPPSS